MKKLLLFLLLFVPVNAIVASNKYTVVAILSKEQVEVNTMAIDEYGSYKKIDYILLPVQLDDGEYSVTLTRKDTDLYQIDGTDLYVKTKYCYEYGYYQKAILIIHNGYYTYGEVVFINE